MSWLFWMVCGDGIGDARASDGPSAQAVVRPSASIVLDGRLDEPVWTRRSGAEAHAAIAKTRRAQRGTKRKFGLSSRKTTSILGLFVRTRSRPNRRAHHGAGRHDDGR